tara:strand:+ start:1262 stop:2146 length:885 start_codon:yes stop_codon:yes gene_type:complete
MNNTELLTLSKMREFVLSRKSDLLYSLYLLLRLKKGNTFFLHWLNTVLGKAIYLFSMKHQEAVSTQDFSATKYVVRSGESAITSGNEKLTQDLLYIAEYMESAPQEVGKITEYVLLSNFSFVQNSMSNQTYFDHVPAGMLSSLAESFRSSEIFRIAQAVSGCELTICNLRCWLFYPLANASDSNVGAHIDGLAPGILKVMFYKGTFTNDKPAINIHHDGEVTPVVGVNPLLLFDANRLMHSAPAPVVGCRPTIEFTLMPRGFFDYQILQAGFMAGNPVNPFKRYNHVYKDLYSK